MSVNVGQTINFKINTPARSYHFDILRIGYYQGNGARIIASGLRPTASLPQSQPSCRTDSQPTGLIDCGNWAVSASWTVPSTAVSGLYIAHLTRDDTGGESQIPFVVRNDASHSDIIVQTSDETWQAYNTYGGNSLYQCNSNCPAGNPEAYKGAAKVSYNRPFHSADDDSGHSWWTYAEYPMIRFLEANGYDVSYTSGVDVGTSAGGSLLNNHKVFLSVGHDEYWSGAQRANVEAARDRGLNLAFFSGNEVFWKTRFEPSIDGSNTANRTLVTYKETHYDAPVDPQDPPTWTGTYVDPRFSPPADGGHPQNSLTGQLFLVNSGSADIKVPSTFSKLRFWRNTAVASLGSGQTLTLDPGGQTLGYEWDEDADDGARPPGLFDLSSTTVNVPEAFTDYGSQIAAATVTHKMTLYRASSGALVFGAGTVQWSFGLDDGDKNMQQATVNLFADMGAQPYALISGLVTATRSTDTTPPTSTISSPASGVSVADGTKMTISGTASDSGGGVVAGVEVSTDGGTSWHPANGTSSWSYTWLAHGTPSTTIKTRAVDDSGNVETPSAGRSVGITCPCSLFGTNATPTDIDSGDGSSVELGVKFQSDTAGTITALRFYKSSGNTGTHIGNLWTSTGTKLASGTFTNETSTGWQTLTFANPVSISANTTYIASYFAPRGHYSQDSGYFYPHPSPEPDGSDSVDSAPLHALRDTNGTHNGVYSYSGSSTFPTQTYNGENYWVDVVFSTGSSGGGGGGGTTPQVTSTSPSNGATGVSTGTAVSATFNESVQSSTIGFTVAGPGGTNVAGSVSYNDTSHTATFTPSAALAASTTYTATVSGAKDASGVTMTAPFTWSFTTAGSSGGGTTCPCSIFSASATPANPNVNDGSAVELGVKFTSDTAGSITGVRFYKSTANTGTHTGSLWSASGTRLATGTFTNETASGWQTLTFSSPVSIQANTTYVASYHTTVGHYAGDNNGLASSVDNSPLHALASGASGGNGVYVYGASAFPTNSYLASNYWVDVVFSTGSSGGGGGGGTTPQVTSTSPSNGATGVSTGTAVSATFNESVQASTIGFTLTGPGTTNVAGSVSYNDTSHTATFTPSAALANSTTYTATVSGAKDASGVTMTAPFTWSFTTAAASGGTTCPCSIFPASATPANPSVNDPNAVELGVKFQADRAGSITGIRFYKGTGNTGTHTGTLWSSTGAVLATGTFTNETASGWQTLTFSSPVSINANTTYVASYHTAVGNYAGDNNGLASAVDNSPLHALASGSSGGNGVYVYGASAFPTNSYLASNYWVDVVFR